MTTDQPAQPLDLAAIREIHQDWETGSLACPRPGGPCIKCQLRAEDAARRIPALVAEVERLRVLLDPAHDPSQPTPPLPLAEGDEVTVTMPARVAGLPDPEADPGAADELWDFAITVAGETEYVSLTQAEVIARVRKQ